MTIFLMRGVQVRPSLMPKGVEHLEGLDTDDTLAGATLFDAERR